MTALEFTVQRVEKSFAELKRQYVNSYRSHHRQIYDHFCPRRGSHLRADRAGDGSKTNGLPMHESVVNSVPLRAARNAASGLQAGVTSPSRPWKKLGPITAELRSIPGVPEYFDAVDREMDSIFASSNLYRCTQTAYMDYVQAMAAIQVDEHDDEVIRCQVHPAGSWYGASNSDGKIDVFYREYNPTGHALRSKFNDDELPQTVVKSAKDNPFSRVKLRNAIEPNPLYRSDGLAIGLAAFPYLSAWWIAGHEKAFIRQHGYYEFPVFVLRMFKTENDDAYGYGIGFDALPDAKQLMFHEDQANEGIDKMVTPPMQAPTSLKMSGGVSHVRGETTYIDGPQKIESLYNVNLPIQYVDQRVLRLEQRISEHYFEDLFLMITQSVDRQVTAREIQERHEEKLIMLGPVLESLNEELLDPLIDRTIAIMRRAGRMPQAPDVLLDVDFKVEYISILAQAQRAIRTVSIEQGVNFTSAMAQAGWPEVVDKLNPDAVADEYFEHIGFPSKAVRPDDEVAGIRSSRAQAQQQERTVAMANQAAPAMTAAAALNEQIQPNVLQSLLARVPSAAASA